MKLLPIAVVLALAAASAGAAASRSLAPFCKGSQLSATFKVVPGSAGAGNIVYALRVRNRSARRCTVTGLPAVRLLGRPGNPLPTHVRAAFPGALTAVLVTLAPGKSARATARFSPDVPGPGEPTTKTHCEPIAFWLLVTARGGGTTRALIQPPTSVCEHGSLQFSAYGEVHG
jgi:hypothetical protein